MSQAFILGFLLDRVSCEDSLVNTLLGQPQTQLSPGQKEDRHDFHAPSEEHVVSLWMCII
jgi:hypothetical protein